MSNILFLLGLLAIFSENSLAKQVCYKNGVGCFTNDPPWENMPLPQDPAKIPPTYLLLQKGQPPRPIKSVHELKLDDLIITTHGFGGSYNSTYVWNSKINSALLEVRPTADILFIDWELGAKLGRGVNTYHQPASNTRVIAQIFALWLKESPEFDSTKVYCVGFSLGAHLCGLTAKRLGTKWGRISAIDPAGPAFIKDDPVARVDINDGIFVDVMHTSWVSLKRPLGHKDFYVNDANFQPGCPQSPGNRRRRSSHDLMRRVMESPSDPSTRDVWDFFDLFACSHYRAAHLFAHTINPTPDCTFIFCPCPSKQHYDKGYCRTCDPSTASLLGYRSIESPNNGTFYGVTEDKDPFCIHEKKAKAKLNTVLAIKHSC